MFFFFVHAIELDRSLSERKRGKNAILANFPLFLLWNGMFLVVFAHVSRHLAFHSFDQETDENKLETFEK